MHAYALAGRDGSATAPGTCKIFWYHAHVTGSIIWNTCEGLNWRHGSGAYCLLFRMSISEAIVLHLMELILVWPCTSERNLSSSSLVH
eukprot:COSAG05_NODE_13001_length_445_cov_0.942197_1_plen_87_part_01